MNVFYFVHFNIFKNSEIAIKPQTICHPDAEFTKLKSHQFVVLPVLRITFPQSLSKSFSSMSLGLKEM